MAYNVQKTFHWIVAANMASSITSKAQNIQNQDNVGIQLHWAGAPVGTFTIQISSNHVETTNGDVVVAGDWVFLVLSPAITASGSADDAYIDLNQMSAMYVRIIYTRTSGTGTLDAYVVSKGV